MGATSENFTGIVIVIIYLDVVFGSRLATTSPLKYPMAAASSGSVTLYLRPKFFLHATQTALPPSKRSGVP